MVEALTILLGLEIMVVLVAAGLGLMVVVPHLLLVKAMLEVLAQMLALNMAVGAAAALAQLAEMAPAVRGVLVA